MLVPPQTTTSPLLPTSSIPGVGRYPSFRSLRILSDHREKFSSKVMKQLREDGRWAGDMNRNRHGQRVAPGLYSRLFSEMLLLLLKAVSKQYWDQIPGPQLFPSMCFHLLSIVFSSQSCYVAPCFSLETLAALPLQKPVFRA